MDKMLKFDVSQLFKKTVPANKQWKLYGWNTLVARIHGVQCLAVVLCIFLKLQNIQSDIPYVSGSQKLKITNHAMTRIDRDYDKCDDVRNSPMYHQMIKIVYPSGLMPTYLYDFTNTSGVEYITTNVRISTPWLICAFFALSCAFQYWNGWLLNKNTDRPRVVHYLEYSVSSSLMIVVLGVNLGIYELYQLLGIFGLFFGMNMFGACAELLCYIVEKGGVGRMQVLCFDQYSMWLVPHMAGWVLFVIAYAPIFMKFCITAYCSDPTLPTFMITAVVVELVLFALFGYVQFAGLSKRMAEIKNGGRDSERLIENMDRHNILLSFFAKTSLAWLLIGPALSVDTGL